MSRLGDAVASLSPRAGSALVLVIVGSIYLLTATYGSNQSVDSAMTSVAAWSVVERGTLDLSTFAPVFEVNDVAAGQVVEVEQGTFANRFPGAIAAGVPFYAIAHVLRGAADVSFGPAGVAAALTTALAVALLHLALRTLTTSVVALAASFAFAFGTSTWSVSADALWTHGPAQLCLAGGMVLMARERHASAGAVWGAGILVRPHVAVVPAVAGFTHSLAERRIGPAARVAATALLGLAAWVLYGRLLFGQWTLLGGYAVPGQLADRIATQAPWQPVVNLWWLIVHPVRGFLPWTPALLWLTPSLPAAWRRAPQWVRSTALAGVGYLLAQAWINRWSGGDAFWSYRYPLEMLTLTVPLWVLAYVASPESRRRTVRLLALIGVALQVPGAVLEIVM